MPTFLKIPKIPKIPKTPKSIITSQANGSQLHFRFKIPEITKIHENSWNKWTIDYLKEIKYKKLLRLCRFLFTNYKNLKIPKITKNTKILHGLQNGKCEYLPYNKPLLY